MKTLIISLVVIDNLDLLSLAGLVCVIRPPICSHLRKACFGVVETLEKSLLHAPFRQPALRVHTAGYTWTRKFSAAADLRTVPLLPSAFFVTSSSFKIFHFRRYRCITRNHFVEAVFPTLECCLQLLSDSQVTNSREHSLGSPVGILTSIDFERAFSQLIIKVVYDIHEVRATTDIDIPSPFKASRMVVCVSKWKVWVALTSQRPANLYGVDILKLRARSEIVSVFPTLLFAQQTEACYT
ncbi:hypothetical protein BDN70DRAFT_994295 [Pholiota conissans]|uniref:Uncharacterized protein n=1 Tax=Pholiota conissans TaxID=109636 RepID=A0A9P6CSJ9_9AGAR|nr:hypothetical protein BDN70DRAFT_994295 [Pholiota conissans]